mgnify:FL=1
MGRAGGGAGGHIGGGGFSGGGHMGGSGFSGGGHRSGSGFSGGSRPSSGSRMTPPPHRPTRMVPPPPPRYRRKNVYVDNRTIIVENGEKSTTTRSAGTVPANRPVYKSKQVKIKEMATIFTAISAFVLIIGGMNLLTSSNVTVREKIDSNVTMSEYYYDDSSLYNAEPWFDNEKQLQKGLDEFYDETGVAPYIAIYSQIDGNTMPSEDEVVQFSEDLYEQKFNDGAHVLVVFVNNEDMVDAGFDYRMSIVPGVQAAEVLDQEAINKLGYNIDANYYSYSGGDEEALFADAFEETADDIMDNSQLGSAKATTAVGVIGLVASLAVGGAAGAAERKRIEDEEKAKETERILNTPL